MAEASYPFDGGSGSIITEQQWSNMSATWQDNGVIAVGPTSSALKVTTLNQVGIVYVEAGEANVLGFHYENTSQLPVAVPSNLTSLTRIDLIVLQLDKNTNAVRVAYREGLAASSPVPPTLVTSGGVYEIALAQIQMNPNTTQVPNTEPQLVDKRTFIGKRIQPTEDVAALPVGAIGYKPSDGKFYAKNGSGTLALGAPPDLSGYSLTTHTHSSTSGVTICTSGTRPGSPSTGQEIYETNTARSFVWDGTAWNQTGFSPLILRRSFIGTQSITLSTVNTAVNVPLNANDTAIGTPTVTWPSQLSTGLLLPTMSAGSIWMLTASLTLPATTIQSSGYYIQLAQSTNILARGGTIGDDTSAVGTATTALSCSTIWSVSGGTTISFIFSLIRTGGTGTVVNASNASLTAHRIG